MGEIFNFNNKALQNGEAVSIQNIIDAVYVMKSISRSDKEGILFTLGQAKRTKDANNRIALVEQVRGYIDALYGNDLMKESEHYLLTMAIDVFCMRGE